MKTITTKVFGGQNQQKRLKDYLELIIVSIRLIAQLGLDCQHVPRPLRS